MTKTRLRRITAHEAMEIANRGQQDKLRMFKVLPFWWLGNLLDRLGDNLVIVSRARLVKVAVHLCYGPALWLLGNSAFFYVVED